MPYHAYLTTNSIIADKPLKYKKDTVINQYQIERSHKHTTRMIRHKQQRGHYVSCDMLMHDHSLV